MTTSPITRRRFLKTGCLTAAAVGLTVCAGGTLAATYQPKIDKPEYHYGEATMPQRILVTYATKAGSTAEIAARIGETLSKKNLAVDVLPVSRVGDLAPYSMVIAGSAIRIGKPLPEVLTFIEKNRATLQQKPFNMFIGCMTLSDDTPANRATVSAYLDPVRTLVKPTHEGLFAGVMNLGKLPLFERLMIKIMKAPEGDFRRWDLITAWADDLMAA